MQVFHKTTRMIRYSIWKTILGRDKLSKQFYKIKIKTLTWVNFFRVAWSSRRMEQPTGESLNNVLVGFCKVNKTNIHKKVFLSILQVTTVCRKRETLSGSLYRYSRPTERHWRPADRPIRPADRFPNTMFTFTNQFQTGGGGGGKNGLNRIQWNSTRETFSPKTAK